MPIRYSKHDYEAAFVDAIKVIKFPVSNTLWTAHVQEEACHEGTYADASPLEESKNPEHTLNYNEARAVFSIIEYDKKVNVFGARELALINAEQALSDAVWNGLTTDAAAKTLASHLFDPQYGECNVAKDAQDAKEIASQFLAAARATREIVKGKGNSRRYMN